VIIFDINAFFEKKVSKKKHFCILFAIFAAYN